MYSPLGTRKTLTIALVALSCVLIFLTLFYSPSFRQYTRYQDLPPSVLHSCPPEAYTAGSWARKPDAAVLAEKSDVLAVSGFEGCASSREVGWHLGVSWDEKDDFLKRQWRGNASAYVWLPGEGCDGYAAVQPLALLQQLVEGGWLVLGDSITEGHFFSLSCMLYPHVRATPDYTIDPWSFDRAWPQNLYLNPSSPLLPQLDLPDGFELDKTPLVTFRRVDLLFGKPELNELYSKLHPADAPASLFSEEGVWDLEPGVYLRDFLAPLPVSNYRTLIVSTAGHWTTTVFSAFHTGDKSNGHGLRELLLFFGKAMETWVDKVAQALEQAGRVGRMHGGRAGKERQIVVRSYLHGHENCHSEEVELAPPLGRYSGLGGTYYNWNWIRRFNDVFQDVVRQRAHPNIHFIPIDTPGLLRPDGHVQGDCLHILTGSGIMEGWSEYISYFVSKLP